MQANRIGCHTWLEEEVGELRCQRTHLHVLNVILSSRMVKTNATDAHRRKYPLIGKVKRDLKPGRSEIAQRLQVDRPEPALKVNVR